MPNIYTTDETDELLEKVSAIDCRTKDGQINYLCKERLKQLSVLANASPNVSVVEQNHNTGGIKEQGNSGE